MGELILSKAKELFFSYGLKSVSMDNLAKQAGISKKTIYQFYSDKAELINTIVDDLIQCHSHLLVECKVNAKDAVDEVLQQSNKSFDTWMAINQTFFFELEKSFPEAWQKLQQHKLNVFGPAIVKNLERGMKENLYRDDLNISIITDIRLHQLTSALQPEAFGKHRMSVSQLVEELTRFYLHGITTEKGKKLLYKYVKNRNENR